MDFSELFMSKDLLYIMVCTVTKGPNEDIILLKVKVSEILSHVKICKHLL